MSKIINKYRELFNYLIVGILTTIVSYGVYFLSTLSLLNPQNKIELQIANIASWIVAVVFAYFTNRKYVFKSKEKNIVKEGSRFCLSRVLTLLLDMLTMFVMVSVLHINDRISKLVSQVFITIGNYIISKFFVFTKKEKKNYKILPTLIKTGLLLLGSAVVGALLLIVVYLLPTSRMVKISKETANVFENGGMYPSIIEGFENARLDNYTDAIIVNESLFKSSDNVVKKAMYVYRNYKNDPLYDVIHTIRDDDSEFIKAEYGRYWHGNLVIVKPFMLLFNYSQIKVLNVFIQSLLLAFTIYLMSKRGLFKNILDFVVSLSLLFPFVMGMSLQFSSVYYVFLITTIVMLKYNEKLKNKYIYLFLMVGALTSYLDLLTFPVLALGMALLFNYQLNMKEKLSDNILDIIKYIVFWGIGYFGMWFSKWAIGSILCHDNFFKLAIDTAKYRSSSGEVSRLSSVWVNIKVFLNTTYIAILLPVVCYHIVQIIRKRKWIKKNSIIDTIPCLIICFVPIAWYFVMSQHSEMHYWFTNKSFVVTIFGILLLLNSLHTNTKKTK